MNELDDILNSLDTANKELYPALAKVVITTISQGDREMLLQTIGSISGRGLMVEQLLVAIRNELSSEKGEVKE